MTGPDAVPLALAELADILRDPQERVRAGVLRADQLAPAGSYVRSPPIFYNLDERHPVSARIRAEITETAQDFPPLHHVVFEGATVTGQGTVVTAGSQLIHDSCWEFFNHKMTPIGLHRLDDDAIALQGLPTRRISRPSLLVKRPWWRNYGHWLLDSAALLALMPGIMMPADWQIVIGTPEPGMRAVVEQTLGTLAPGIPVIEHADDETWVFDELHYTTPVSRPGLFKLPQGLAALRAQFLGSSCLSPRRKKLYVTRGAGDRRRLLNEDAIVQLCVARGFEVVRPEELSLLDQARLFHAADTIVGVKGAALTNLLFCTSAAAVVVLSPEGWMDLLFWDLASQLGLTYVEVIGSAEPGDGSPAQKPFSIDPVLFGQALDDLAAARAPQRPVDLAADEPAPLPTTPPRESGAAIEVFAHIQDEGDVTAGINQRLGGSTPDHAIEGFGIRLSRHTPPGEIEYRGVVGKNWPTPWVQGGAFCGTRGWRLPLFGFAVRLHGRTEQQYQCAYDATFADGTSLRAVSDGQDCVSETLAPLTSLTIRLRRRPAPPPPGGIAQDHA